MADHSLTNFIKELSLVEEALLQWLIVEKIRTILNFSSHLHSALTYIRSTQSLVK